MARPHTAILDGTVPRSGACNALSVPRTAVCKWGSRLRGTGSRIGGHKVVPYCTAAHKRWPQCGTAGSSSPCGRPDMAGPPARSTRGARRSGTERRSGGRRAALLRRAVRTAAARCRSSLVDQRTGSRKHTKADRWRGRDRAGSGQGGRSPRRRGCRMRAAFRTPANRSGPRGSGC